MGELQVWKAIWQIRFPAASLLFDKRGQIAARWQHRGDLSEWRIDSTSVSVHNLSKTLYLKADIRSITVVAEGSEAYKQFERFAIEFVLETLKALEIHKLERIGLRLLQAEQRDNFQKLCGNMRRKIYRLSEDEWKVLGGYPKDVGLHLVLAYDDSRIAWAMGPMEKSQLQAEFEAIETRDSLPDVMLFSDCDLSLHNPKFAERSFEKELRRYFTEGTQHLLDITHQFVDQFEGFE